MNRTKLLQMARRHRRMFGIGFIAILVLLVSVWVWTLDRRVRGSFDENRWSEPSRVYARPLPLYPGKPIGLRKLKSALRKRGYVPVESVVNPGQFRVMDGGIHCYLRRFDFLNEPRRERSVKVLFSGGRIQRLEDVEFGESISLIRLEPIQIGSFFGPGYRDRIPVTLDQVPELMIETLLWVEDRHFHRHPGLDPGGMLRALWANMKAGEIVQGGSTLTQQLVKNRFLNNRRTWGRKITEAVLAPLVELHYDKRAILRAYLNEVYLGQLGNRAIRGVGRASRFYFGTSVERLSPGQVALLVGMIQAPSFYNPRRHPKRARRRRDQILSRMHRAKLITDSEYRRTRERAIHLSSREDNVSTSHPRFLELVRRRLRRKYPREELETKGLRIYTTLRPEVQRRLESRVPQRLEKMGTGDEDPDTPLQTSVIVTRVQTGEISALLGGRRPGYPGFNRALDARRPIGSLIKPAIYLTALSRPDSYTLVSRIRDEPFSVRPAGDRQPWTPRNFDGQYHGDVPLVQALTHSYNVATARLGLKLGVGEVLETVRELGVNRNFDTYPAVLLGSLSMSPLEITRMYQSIANGGYRTTLKAIRGVRTRRGRTLQRSRMKLERAFDPGPVHLLNRALRNVMERGTGRELLARLEGDRRVAGKTGTTQDFRDSWFVGYGRNRLITVWVGRDDFQPAGLTGSRGAGEIWADLARELKLRSLPPGAPPSVRRVKVHRGSWLPSKDRCRKQMDLPFLVGSVPERTAPCARGWFDSLLGSLP